MALGEANWVAAERLALPDVEGVAEVGFMHGVTISPVRVLEERKERLRAGLWLTSSVTLITNCCRRVLMPRDN